jgi:hypothetical protein
MKRSARSRADEKGLRADPTSQTPTTRTRASRVELEFPWGVVGVDKRMGIGRDPEFSPLADHLSGSPNISRRHAEVWMDGPEFYVRDVGPGAEGSTNGTFVNDRRIGADERVPLRDGDRLRLGDDPPLEARVRVVADGG